jgi:hypothetical protein
VQNFSHICIGVSDIEASLAFTPRCWAWTSYSTSNSTGPAVDIGGVRMFFIYDPDGTPIELLELPAGISSTLQLWRPGG